MARKFEEANIKINQEVQVDTVKPSDAKAMDEVSALYRAWTNVNGPIYLDSKGSQHYFLGRLPNIEGILGFVSLRNYGNSPLYGVSMLTHPDFESRGIATALTKSAVDFAYSNNMAGLFAHVVETSRSEAIIRRFGFRAYSMRWQLSKKHLTYHLDTTKREPLRDYNDLNDIESPLVKILRSLGIPDSNIPNLFTRVNWCDSVLAATVTFGAAFLQTQDGVEKILSQHFADSFVYPNIPKIIRFYTFDVEATVHSVEPSILGPQHRLALDGQKVYFHKSEDFTQLAVVRPFEEEKDLFSVNFYEMTVK